MLWPAEMTEQQLLLQMDGEENNGFASTAPRGCKSRNRHAGNCSGSVTGSHLRLYMDSSSNRITVFGTESLSKECIMYPEFTVTFILEIIPSCRFWLWSKCAGGPQTVVLPGHQFCSQLSSDTCTTADISRVVCLGVVQKS